MEQEPITQNTNGHSHKIDKNSDSENENEKSTKSDDLRSFKLACNLIVIFNFFCAIIKDGFAPLVSIYLVAIRGWEPGNAGIIWMAREISMVVAQVPMGDFIDKTAHKKTLVMTVSFVAALCSNVIIVTDIFWILIIKCVVEGIAASGIDPGKGAITLGITGPDKFEKQTSKNEMSNHAGMMFFAGVCAALAYYVYPNTQWLFFTILVSGIICVICVYIIPSKLIKHDVARNISTEKHAADQDPASYCDILKDRSIMMLLVSVFTFHLGNAAVLPLVGQLVASEGGRTGVTYGIICIIIAQLVSIPSAWFAEKYSKKIGYKVVLCIGYISVTIRCVCIILINKYFHNKKYLIPTQILDGIGAGITTLMIITFTSCLTHGTGRFNITFSMMHVGWMLGSSMSNVLGGFLANINYNLAIIVLGSISVIPIIATTFGIKEPNRRDILDNKKEKVNTDSQFGDSQVELIKRGGTYSKVDTDVEDITDIENNMTDVDTPIISQ
eukprot:455584_1